MPLRLRLHVPHRPVRTLVLEEGGPYSIGRDEACDVPLPDSRVSRRHAEMKGVSGTEWRLRDLDSKNGTILDGRRLDSQRWTPLADGAWVSFGGLPARAEMLSEAQRRGELAGDARRLETSLTLARRLDPSLGLTALLEQLLTSVVETSGAERAFVLLAEDDGRTRVAACRGVSRRELGSEAFAGSFQAVETALTERRAVVAAETSEDDLLAERPSVVDGSIRSLVCLPLEVMDRVLGVVYADSTRPGDGFTELDVEILSALAAHAALALAVARIHRELTGRTSSGDPDPVWERSLPACRPGFAPAPEGEP